MAQAEPGDAVAGSGLARELCSFCHLVGADQPGPAPDGVPTFMAIAAQPDMTPDRIIESLISPSHPMMPLPPHTRQLMPLPPITGQQMRDVIAYIISLRAR